MSEEQEVVTQDEQDDTTQGSEVSIETVTVQKRKALEQRNEEREKNNRSRQDQRTGSPRRTSLS